MKEYIFKKGGGVKSSFWTNEPPSNTNRFYRENNHARLQNEFEIIHPKRQGIIPQPDSKKLPKSKHIG